MWQSTSLLNDQRPIEVSGANIGGFYKTVDQICELNYRENKYEIRGKMWDQKYNFTFILKRKAQIECRKSCEEARFHNSKNYYHICSSLNANMQHYRIKEEGY